MSAVPFFLRWYRLFHLFSFGPLFCYFYCPVELFFRGRSSCTSRGCNPRHLPLPRHWSSNSVHASPLETHSDFPLTVVLFCFLFFLSPPPFPGGLFCLGFTQPPPRRAPFNSHLFLVFSPARLFHLPPFSGIRIYVFFLSIFSPLDRRVTLTVLQLVLAQALFI